MSLADAPPGVAPVVTDVFPLPPRREPLRRRRLDLIYFVLAGIDLLTITFTLLLSNHIVTLYQQSVARSGVWSDRVSELVVMAQYAQETNAPGNDVFDSHDVAHERQRRDAGLAVYLTQRDAILADLARTSSAEEEAIIAEHIREADVHMTAMMREADQIFAEIEAGRDEAAGRRMATMDRVYGRLTHAMLEAIIKVQEVEDANLERQVALAGQIRALEFVVMGLILFIVFGVVLYGRRIGSVMRATEDAHNEMLVELEAANEGLQQYADNVAHELRSPVNKMLLASEVALSRPRSASEYQDTFVSIVEECQQLSNIVGSLLFLARARRTKVDLERHRINVGVELKVIHDYFEASAQEAGIHLSVISSADVALHVDRTLFQRAVSNLVSNALSHTNRGGAIDIRASALEDRVAIEVRDNGEGMSAAAQGRVFDRFYRADAARSASSGRIGLGLSITKSIVELHGGSIMLRSVQGEGASITLLFPR
jgi:two-component system, OmpR family, heavy metal sensor histidine kinase CusS